MMLNLRDDGFWAKSSEHLGLKSVSVLHLVPTGLINPATYLWLHGFLCQRCDFRAGRRAEGQIYSMNMLMSSYLNDLISILKIFLYLL